MTDQEWQHELSIVTEALEASTEARRLMDDTIRDLRTENEHLRAAVARLVGLRPLELTDREPWGDGCVYHAEAGV